MKRLWAWLRPSLEGDDGKASYRRLSALVFILLICYMVLADKIQSNIHLYAFYGLLGTFLLLAAVITTSDIIKFKNGEKLPDSTVKVGDIVTTEIKKVEES